MSSSPEAQHNTKLASPDRVSDNGAPLPAPPIAAAAAAAAEAARVGGDAARRVYLSPEVFLNIMTMMDDHTLTVMLRVERGEMASVSGVIYRKVDRLSYRHVILPGPRRAMYCAAVRTLDNSPPPQIRILRRPRQHTGQGIIPGYMIPSEIHKIVSDTRNSFPNIRSILYRYPQKYADDDYAIKLNGGQIIVELQSFVLLDALYTPPTSKIRSHKFPATPVYPGIEFRHTLALKLSKCRGPDFGGLDWGLLSGLWKQRVVEQSET